MKQFRRKLLGVMLALAMVLTVLPLNKIVASAAPAPTPLTFTAEEANSSVTFKWASATFVEYSTDGGNTWRTYDANTTITLPNVGDKVSFRGTNVTTNDGNHFSMAGKIAASGDVTSLTNGIGGDVALTSMSCYVSMFRDCTSLTSAPALPSTTLEINCYYNMFRDCTGLTSAPALPATTLKGNCYYFMFSGCTSLTSAPVLPATTMAGGCYAYMFHGCTSLSSAPVLPATTLANSCYRAMFAVCTGLSSAPALPATVLADYCYNLMFSGCTSLSSVPSLPATTLEYGCYYRMFYGCSKLIVAETSNVSEATWIFPVSAASYWNCEMIAGLTAPGTLTEVEAGKMYKVSYIGAPTPPAPTPLTFTAEEANSSVTFKWVSGTSVEYSMNGGAWSTYTADTAITLPNVGDKVSFRGTDVKTGSGNHFTMTGKIAASGDVTSLTNGIGGDATLFSDCYSYMFLDCTSLTGAPALPATSLANGCYYSMFDGCTSLTSAPALPATSLSNYCYYGMFAGCTSLTSAPALPATTLANSCYESMFIGCTNLASVPKLKATSLSNYCYYCMFEGCTNLIVTETTNASEATWVFPALGASVWNGYMLDGLTAPGTLTEVELGKMYKVDYVVPLPTPPAPPAPPATPVGSNYNKTIAETNVQLEAMAEKLAKGEKVEDATVYLTSGDSLPLSIMKTLKKCPGVTLDFQCTYKGEKLHFVLKGGEKLVINENIPWYGPLYLKSVYGVVGDEKDTEDKAPNTVVYLVKRGDTLYRISRGLGISIADLLKKNPQIKNPNRIWAGQILNY